MSKWNLAQAEEAITDMASRLARDAQEIALLRSRLAVCVKALEATLNHFDNNFEWADCASEDSWIARRTKIHTALREIRGGEGEKNG